MAVLSSAVVARIVGRIVASCSIGIVGWGSMVVCCSRIGLVGTLRRGRLVHNFPSLPAASAAYDAQDDEEDQEDAANDDAGNGSSVELVAVVVVALAGVVGTVSPVVAAVVVAAVALAVRHCCSIDEF